MSLTCPYCGKSGFKNLVSHTRQKHGKNLELLLQEYPDIKYETDESYNNRINSVRKTCQTEEFCTKMSKVISERQSTPEGRQKCRDKMINQQASGNIVPGSGYQSLKHHLETDDQFRSQYYQQRSDALAQKWVLS